MPSEQRETPASKLLWRLKHGDKASIVRAIQQCPPVDDAETIAAVLQALSYSDVDVRENAAHVLAAYGDEVALEPLLRAAALAPDREERLNHERAAAAIESRTGS